jgi:hypothetical protein
MTLEEAVKKLSDSLLQALDSVQTEGVDWTQCHELLNYGKHLWFESRGGCHYRKSDRNVLMMYSSEERKRANLPR